MQPQRPVQAPMNPAIMQQQQQHRQINSVSNSGWSHEFGRFDEGMAVGSGTFEDAFNSAQQSVPMSQSVRHPMNSMVQKSVARPLGWNSEFLHSSALQSSFRQPLQAMTPQIQHNDPIVEREWQQQFSQFEAVDEKGKGPMTASSIPQTHVHGDLDSWKDEFEKLDLKGFDEALGENKGKFTANWEEEFANMDFDAATTEEERQALMKKMGDVWAELKKAEHEEAGEAAGMQNPWDGGYEDFMNEFGGQQGEVVDPDPVTAPWTGYKFEPDNPYLGYSDSMEQGLKILESPGGSLSQAALAFEAAVQMGQIDNSEAWMYLGKVQAENEKEEAAISAFQRSVQLNPGNLDALMGLSVCYTNENQELQAYATLNRWLTTKYPAIPENIQKSDPNSYTSTYEIHESTTSRFIQAVQSSKGVIDPDLQLGLGVLFYNRNEYDKVIDCFSSALRVRSGDYLLWNRLGATLANSGRSEEAIEAYRKALELKPSFVRCRYNLGVSCINIGCYREAAEHLLGALSLHVVGDQKALGYVNVSENLWDTLRRTFIQMSRMDLAEMTQTDRDVNKYRKEFDF
ncbi:Peroxisomal membrane signal receptor PTS1 [Rhizoclosmatium sp. JEL0117]|nr:Peroxisomal membrane signal receptor PTS1 [Rhizoclosmatium sp. JEL0117]